MYNKSEGSSDRGAPGQRGDIFQAWILTVSFTYVLAALALASHVLILIRADILLIPLLAALLVSVLIVWNALHLRVSRKLMLLVSLSWIGLLGWSVAEELDIAYFGSRPSYFEIYTWSILGISIACLVSIAAPFRAKNGPLHGLQRTQVVHSERALGIVLLVGSVASVVYWITEIGASIEVLLNAALPIGAVVAGVFLLVQRKPTRVPCLVLGAFWCVAALTETLLTVFTRLGSEYLNAASLSSLAISLCYVILVSFESVRRGRESRSGT